MANKKKYYRNANGQGTVYKLSGNRRRPWVAAVTTGWEPNLNTGKARQIQKAIGYFETRQQAIAALSEYNSDPYDLCSRKPTFSEVYEEWSKDHFENIVPAAVRTIKSAYNHSEPLHNMYMIDIKARHLEECIKNSTVGDATKARMKSLYNMIYKYALKHEIVNKDYSALCETMKRGNPNKEPVPFSKEEIDLLWNSLDIPWVDMILIGIYSGWRPQELAILKTSDIDIENETMLGGLKTDSGKDRIVPFNRKISDLIKKRYDPGSVQLFMDENNMPMTYDKIRSRWTKVMKQLNMDHRPHETRHTFITLMKEAGANEYAIKLLVGHSINDVTEKVYTHRTIEDLRKEINKI